MRCLAASQLDAQTNLTFTLNPLEEISATYAPAVGVLEVGASVLITGIKHQRNSLSAQWRNATLQFAIKYRDKEWTVLTETIALTLEDHIPRPDESEDETPDFPSTEFWD